MVTTRFKVVGTDKVAGYYNNLARELSTGRTIVEMQEAEADTVLKAARRKAPKKTNRLRRNSGVRTMAQDTVIAFSEMYATFIEFGTRHIKESMFLRSTIHDEQVQRRAVRRAGKVLNRLLLRGR